MSCAKRSQVDDYFSGRKKAGAEHSLRQHLLECADCTDRYKRHLLLGALSPRVPSPKARLKRGIDFGAPSRHRFRTPVLLLAATALSAICLLLVIRPPRSEFTARGKEQLTFRNELHMYRIKDGKPQPVGDAISARDELGFTYRNPTGKPYLLVFAVDEHGHFYWYHPTWIKEDLDPTAIRISGGDEIHELSEVTAHDFDGQSLRFFAVFAQDPFSVKQVEALAKRQGSLPLPLSRAIQVELKVRVAP